MCVKQLYKYIKTKIRMLKEWAQRDYKPHKKYMRGRKIKNDKA